MNYVEQKPPQSTLTQDEVKASLWVCLILGFILGILSAGSIAWILSR